MASDDQIIHVTIDTNILQELWRNQDKSEIVKDLLTLSDKGRLDLAVTTRIEYDIPLPPLSERFDELPVLGVQKIGTVGRWGVSTWGGGDFWSDGRAVEVESAIASSLHERGLRAPETADFDHIFGHHIAERDVFLTWDKAILRAADLFREHLGVRIVAPEDFLAELS